VVARLGLDFPILSDPDARAVEAYGVLHEAGGIGGVDIARPAIFIVDSDGRIAWRHVPENWRVRIRPETIIEALENL
jgi:peroxiredoxin